MSAEISKTLLEEYIAANVFSSRHHIHMAEQSLVLLENAYDVQDLLACRRTLESMQSAIETALHMLNCAITLRKIIDYPQACTTIEKKRKNTLEK